MCKEHLNFVTKCLFQQFMQVNIGNNGQYDVLQKGFFFFFRLDLHDLVLIQDHIKTSGKIRVGFLDTVLVLL